MPKHIESRQSRLGADQPGGFCVRFFFRISGGRGAEAKFQSMEMQVVPVVPYCQEAKEGFADLRSR